MIKNLPTKKTPDPRLDDLMAGSSKQRSKNAILHKLLWRIKETRIPSTLFWKLAQPGYQNWIKILQEKKLQANIVTNIMAKIFNKFQKIGFSNKSKINTA